MTTTYSYLEKMKRTGATSWNGKVTLASTTITLGPYDGGVFSTTNPLLVRFPDTSTTAVYAGSRTFDWGSSTWGLANYDGTWDVYVGLQRVSDSAVQIVVGLDARTGSVTSELPANVNNNIHQVAGEASVTGTIVWIAKMLDVVRTNGTWDTSSATVINEEGA